MKKTDEETSCEKTDTVRKHHVKKQRKDRKWQDMKNLIENTSGQEKEKENWRILGDKSWHDRKKKYKYARWQHNKK